MEYGAREDDEEHEKHDRPHDEEREVPRTALELRLGRAGAESRRDVAERRRGAGRRDDGRGRAAHHRRAKEHPMAIVIRVTRLLRCRQRFTGERGLVNVEITGLHQPGVRGHPVACRQSHDVAGHDAAPRDLHPAPVAEDARRRRDRLAEALGRPL